jgi:TolB-like protein/Tfp pilus assembly protein PilF
MAANSFAMSSTREAQSAAASHADRLDSWKEIAAHLNRGVTTVQRWERTEGLPIHRLRHDSLGSVYAYKKEIEDWRTVRALRPEPKSVVTSLTRVEAIAVLPFEHLSNEPEAQYLADAMTDVLTTALARTGGIKVASRTSAMRYRHVARSIKKIADELHVDALVEGSVTRVGEHVRITAQLIDASTDRHLWAQSYDGEIKDILRLQGDVARAITTAIGSTIPALLTNRPEPRAVQPRAYDAYVKGMHHLHKFTPEGFERALGYFRQAIEADSNDALSWAGLAFAYSMISHCDLPARQPRQAFAQVKAAALRALELDDSLAEAHVALAGLRLYYEWNWAAADAEFQRALYLNPTLAEAHRHYGWYLFLVNRVEDALSELRAARDAEPLTALYTAELGWAYWLVGKSADAEVEVEGALELDKDFPVGLFVRGVLLRDRGRDAEAVAAHERAAQASPGWRWALGETYALTGRSDLARRMLAEWADGAAPDDAWEAFTLAYVSAALGDRDQAIRGLEALYTHRHGWTPWMCKGIQAFAPLIDDPRFQEIAKRLNLPVA